MKTTLCYSTSVTLCVYALGMKADLNMGCKPLSEIVDYAKEIFNDNTMFLSETIDQIVAIDSDTGEILAEFTNDKNDPFDDNDWEFDEDMGFDPYEGSYTYDC